MKTHEDADVRALHVTIAAPRDEVFAFLADIENLPRWAECFCAELEIASCGWRAWTAFGDLFVELEADARAGTVDIRWGGELEPLADVPLRIWARPGGGTLVGGWLVRAPRQSAESFAKEAAAFDASLQRLAAGWRSRAARLCA